MANSFRVVAQTLFEFFEAMRSQGFSHEEAFEITKAYIQSTPWVNEVIRKEERRIRAKEELQRRMAMTELMSGTEGKSDG